MNSTSRSLLILTLVLAALAAVAGLVNAEPDPGTCTPWGPQDLPDPVNSDPGRRQERLIAVPVIIHLMQADIDDSFRNQHPGNPTLIAPPGNPVRRWWNKEAVRRFFAREGLVNRIWNQGGEGIRLAVRRVEECVYQPRRLRSDLGPQDLLRDSVIVPHPEGGQQTVEQATRARTFFREVNAVFLRRDPNALHVLLWWVIGELSTDAGYAQSRENDGPAAWLDTKCVNAAPLAGGVVLKTEDGCARMIAHEIGHAFTLCHVCRSSPAGGNRTERCPLPPPCFSTNGGTANLMSDNFHGKDLQTEQLSQAKENASTFLQR